MSAPGSQMSVGGSDAITTPNVAHFAYTTPSDSSDGYEFSLIHYCAVASALAYGQVDEVLIHTTTNPHGYWWRRATDLATTVHAVVPQKRFNSTFRHPAHKADAIRLSVLEQHGGVFMDLDVLTLRALTPLLDTGRPVVGMEDAVAICPAVIITPPNAPFISRWIDGYNPATSEWSGFRSAGRDQYWGELSTRYPIHLATAYPTEVMVLPPSAFYPVHWRRRSCARLYRDPAAGGLTPADLAQSYTLHLWQTGQRIDALNQLTVEQAQTKATTLLELLAPLLEMR